MAAEDFASLVVQTLAAARTATNIAARMNCLLIVGAVFETSDMMDKILQWRTIVGLGGCFSVDVVVVRQDEG